jgi:hypothetical protein
MSTFETPVAAEKPPSVSPVATLAGKRILGAGFDPEILDIMVTLLEPEPGTNDAVKKGLDDLFTGSWKVKRWFDLRCFNSDDVAAMLAPDGPGPTVLKTPVITKKLGFIIDFAELGELTRVSTMDGILRVVKEDKRSPAISKSTALSGSPTDRTDQAYDKKTVPTLDKFSGQDEDYFTWKESTINKLGIAGVGRFVDDELIAAKYPEVAESVFYALRGAVHGGQAQSIAQSMLDEKTYDPLTLWKRLEAFYDTNLNRASVLLFGIRRLVDLRLDSGSNATKFVSDYRDCMQRLRKINARLADDEDALRTLLLVAIRDDDFECVRDNIIRTPGMSVEAILSDIREREKALTMKERESHHIGGDGMSTSRHSRRTQQSNNRNDGGSRGGNDSTATKSGGRWNIPRFPDSWKQSFGAAIFKLLMAWRVEAHKGKTQGQLTEEYSTFVERVNKPMGSGQSKSRSRRMSTGDDTTVSISASGNTSNDGDNQPSSGADGDVQKRKRIRLNKSRRIVTERNA